MLVVMKNHHFIFDFMKKFMIYLFSSLKNLEMRPATDFFYSLFKSSKMREYEATLTLFN